MNLHRKHLTPSLIGYRHAPAVSIRWARPEDEEKLELLAELDEDVIPVSPLMLGFVDDELWAAVSVSSGAAICDPFKPSAEVARLVAERGRQLTLTRRDSAFRLLRRRLQPSRALRSTAWSS